jgi:hypothetical protein
MSDEPDPVHDGVIVIEDIATPGAPVSAGVPTVHFNRYPGSQQIVLWLPRSRYEGYEDVITLRDGVEIEHETAQRKVSGSTQILWDTLAWPPGAYRIVITHRDGWRHEVTLRKYEPGADPAPPPAPPPQPEPSRGPIVYRDGFGNVLPDVDLQMRADLHLQMKRRYARRLEYEGNFRAGTIIYDDGKHRIRFYNEMCGGELHCAIEIPTKEHWEAATGVPLSERAEIIAFLAERVQAEQASSWRFRITDRSIDFY